MLDRSGCTTWAGIRAWARRCLASRSPSSRIVGVLFFTVLALFAVSSIAAVGSNWWPSLEAFGNLQVHIAAGCAAVTLVALLARFRGWAAAGLVLLLVNGVSLGLRSASVSVCPVESAAAGQVAVRIMTHNILHTNHDFESFRRVVEAQRPDVIFLAETRPFHNEWFDKLRSQYPYRANCDVYQQCGVAILSRYPLEKGHELGGDDVMVLKTIVSVGEHKLTFLGTYIVQPFPGQGQSWEFRALTRIISMQPSDAVLVGDFNSVPWSPHMSHFIAAAGVCTANLTHATFPGRFGPFGLPIDQVFLKPDVGLLNIQTVGGTGSDHKALLATVSIR